MQNADDARTGPEVAVDTLEVQAVQLVCEVDHDILD
jgi:hypothetical protein